MTIFFNTRGEKYTEFRTTSEHSIELDGERWRSVEHYVQAQRFNCPKLKAQVRDADYAFEGKTLAREQPEALRGDWNDVRYDMMEKAVQAKFKRHSSLAAKLRATGKAEIIEASACSHYWGVGADGTGQNKLGKILMKVRRQLQEQPAYSI
ncbi:MAG: NADAR family protein [Kordiimonadaceae bacterium]|nr:NADAR family protein [Kordiimonadaceae bacterium]